MPTEIISPLVGKVVKVGAVGRDWQRDLAPEWRVHREGPVLRRGLDLDRMLDLAAVLNLGMALLGMGGVLVLLSRLAARWSSQAPSAHASGSPRRGAVTVVQVALVLGSTALIAEGSLSWRFKPLLVPVFVLWAIATMLYGWPDLVALWRGWRHP